MMRVYICPNCGWIRTVSRRKTVECFQCGEPDMSLARLSFLDYSEMDEEQRDNYVQSWLFIHKKDTQSSQ